MNVAMTWSLVKKDFLLAKKFTLMVLGVGIVIPIFIAMQEPALGGIGVFLFMAMYTILIFSQYVTATENKFEKAEALLFASPYTRFNFVAAKYVFYLIVFAACLLIYYLLSLIAATHILFELGAVAVTLLVTSIVYGFLLPLQLKLGVEKTRYVFIILLFGVSFGAPVVMPLLSNVNFSALNSVPGWVFGVGAVILSALFLTASARVSLKVYTNKEF